MSKYKKYSLFIWDECYHNPKLARAIRMLFTSLVAAGIMVYYSKLFNAEYRDFHAFSIMILFSLSLISFIGKSAIRDGTPAFTYSEDNPLINGVFLFLNFIELLATPIAILVIFLWFSALIGSGRGMLMSTPTIKPHYYYTSGSNNLNAPKFEGKINYNKSKFDYVQALNDLYTTRSATDEIYKFCKLDSCNTPPFQGLRLAEKYAINKQDYPSQVCNTLLKVEAPDVYKLHQMLGEKLKFTYAPFNSKSSDFICYLDEKMHAELAAADKARKASFMPVFELASLWTGVIFTVIFFTSPTIGRFLSKR